jgi:hypothetical protein
MGTKGSLNSLLRSLEVLAKRSWNSPLKLLKQVARLVGEKLRLLCHRVNFLTYSSEFYLRLRSRALVVRSGYVNVNLAILRNAGQNGYDWSSRTYSTTTNACNLKFDASAVNPSNNSNRYNGFSLRCLDFVPAVGADLLEKCTVSKGASYRRLLSDFLNEVISSRLS